MFRVHLGNPVEDEKKPFRLDLALRDNIADPSSTKTEFGGSRLDQIAVELAPPNHYGLAAGRLATDLPSSGSIRDDVAQRGLAPTGIRDDYHGVSAQFAANVC